MAEVSWINIVDLQNKKSKKTLLIIYGKNTRPRAAPSIATRA
jgi:hypothetical protein